MGRVRHTERCLLVGEHDRAGRNRFAPRSGVAQSSRLRPTPRPYHARIRGLASPRPFHVSPPVRLSHSERKATPSMISTVTG